MENNMPWASMNVYEPPPARPPSLSRGWFVIWFLVALAIVTGVLIGSSAQ